MFLHSLYFTAASRCLQDVGTIDSEGPKTCADRKAALRRQQQVLREDIENLQARAVLQVRFSRVPLPRLLENAEARWKRGGTLRTCQRLM